ncbi:MAG: hypothetical protein GTO55_07100 [Armatimonadetes bacterium]|nr:hypothetical protein [Armatimonadota bacterium]NIM24041.1 hypothetical protein [Armatimonadota bacterium]NIM67891.1 hypothetical protein [Armatimonadota bacterium]NIN06121.1 hypothetical protein [Armatimonadota bacterium]NIO97535.1 hypothetical protein [Armatimonadota bacterium]
MRKFSLVVVLLAVIGALAAHGTPADEVILHPKPTEVTLYTQNIAEVTAVASHFGEGNITLWLPRTIEEDSVVIEDGGRPLAHTLKPVIEEAKIGAERTKEYLVKLSGLPAGEHSFLIRYQTRGLGWNPNYSLTVDKPGEGVLRSVVSITNNALELNAVTLRLVSGLVQTRGYGYEYGGYDYPAMLYRMMAQRSPHIPSLPTPGNICEIQVLDNMTIPEQATRQLPVQEVRLGVDKLLVWETMASEYLAPMGRGRPTAVYTLNNQTGRPLAEGKVKIYEKKTFVGDGFLGWTLEGDKGTLVLAGVKDLTVQKEEKTEELPQTWECRHITTLKIINHGDLPTRVQIIDQTSSALFPLPRLSRNRRGIRPVEPIVSFSEDPEITDEGAYSWTVTVPAQQQYAISYDYVRALDPSKFLVLHFECDDSPDERRYIFEDSGSTTRPRRLGRYIDYDANVIYRLDLPDDLARADMVVGMGGNFLVSIALEANGKPGAFEVLMRADLYRGRRVKNFGNRAQYSFDLSPYLSRSNDNVFYLKFEDATRYNRWGTWLEDVQIYRVPEGFPSRGRDYMKEALASRPQPRRGEMLFSDDFDREDLEGWQPERAGAKGHWEVSEGWLSPNTFISNERGLLTERSFPRDLVITSRWQAADPEDFVMCVVFSHGEDPENYYYLVLWTSKSPPAARIMFWDGRRKSLITTSLDLDPSVAHELTLEVDKQRVRAWQDGLLLIDWDDTLGRLKRGPIGFRGKKVRMDWVKVHALASE